MRRSRGVRAGRGHASDANQNGYRGENFTGYFLRQGRLDHFGVVQMRGDGRADLW